MQKKPSDIKNLAPSPFQHINRRKAFKNSCLEVFYDHIVGPGGFEVEDYIVLSPINKGENLVAGVAV